MIVYLILLPHILVILFGYLEIFLFIIEKCRKFTLIQGEKLLSSKIVNRLQQQL